MGNEKHGSKGVGGFLQMFDWNAKSRKKLFSSRSDIPEQSKQKKRCDGNLPTTRFQMMEEDEFGAGSSIKGSSDYSCASSVTDEYIYRPKAPGVVARLMGLDSLPKTNEPYSTPLFDTQSLRDSYGRTKNLESHQDQIMHTETEYQKVIHRPIEKFQTEILPPKSAKSIPITHHKLLSPIKGANFIPPKDAAYIMEAAARIIESGPQASTRTKMPHASSSSVPSRVQDLKEKVRATQKPLKIFEVSHKKAKSSAGKSLKGHSMTKSWNGSVDSEESSSVGVKNKGQSISLALQAKANVQKREGLHTISTKKLPSQVEPCEFHPNHVFKSQSSTQKSVIKKPSSQSSSSVLRQNNQKQNCIVDRGKVASKSNSQGAKAVSGDYLSRQRNSSKLSGTSKVSSRKLSSEVKDDKREALSSSPERVTRKKRSIDGNHQPEKGRVVHNKNGEAVKSSAAMNMQSSWDQEGGSMGTDVISFTFTAPMTRSGPQESSKIFSQSKRTQLTSDGMSASKFSFMAHNLRGGDALSTLMEQKPKESTHKVELSQQKSGSVLHEPEPGMNALKSSTVLEGHRNKDRMQIDKLVRLEAMDLSHSDISEARKFLDCRLPSPVSVLEHPSFADSCNSSDTAESSSSGGSKQCSSVQAQEVIDSYSSKIFLPTEGDVELSDSASSTSSLNVAKRRETTLMLTSCQKPIKWELEYVKKILCNIDIMFKDYASGQTHDIINPLLFNQLESLSGNLIVSKTNRRVLFDCVGECLDLRCTQYVSGGFKSWAKGVSVVGRKERLAEEVYKEISSWSAMGDYMVDELVDKDMSSQYGRWLDFDIEAFEIGVQIESRILNTLMDEVVADILVL